MRLAGYFHDLGKIPAFDGEGFKMHELMGADIVDEILSRFRFTKKEIERVKNLVKFHMRSYQSFSSPKAVRKFLKALEDHNVSFKDWLRLRIADRQANLTKDPYTLSEIKTMLLKVENAKNTTPTKTFGVTSLEINGNNVMKILNIKPGKQIGEVLNHLVDVVLDDPEKNERETLISLVRNYNERVDNI